MTTVLLDTHVLYWATSARNRLSEAAMDAIVGADDLAVASITWFELAWLATRGRIATPIPVMSWLEQLTERVRTVGINARIAATAVALPGSFPGDPADRLIYATAIERGWPLVTRDDRMRSHPHPRQVVVW